LSGVRIWSGVAGIRFAAVLCTYEFKRQMQIRLHNGSRELKRRALQAMTLVEVMVAFAISGLAVTAIVSGYVYSLNAAEKFSLSLAANAQATERVEQIRSARWNSTSSPVVDEVVASNFPAETVTLDLAGAGGGAARATNYTQITTISTTPPLKRIHVDCVWVYARSSQLITNSIETCRAPDQ
jgi:type II secretory pathway pseudopilin PulG